VRGGGGSSRQFTHSIENQFSWPGIIYSLDDPPPYRICKPRIYTGRETDAGRRKTPLPPRGVPPRMMGVVPRPHPHHPPTLPRSLWVTGGVGEADARRGGGAGGGEVELSVGISYG